MNAIGLALWLPRIPDIKEKLDLDVLAIALCLIGAPIGTFLGFLFAARLVRSIGLKRTCIIAGGGMCLLLIPPAAVTSAIALFATLLIVGISIALIEVAMNSKANVVQRNLGRRIMSRCHAMWSFGVMAAGLLAGSLAQADVSTLKQQIIMEPIAAVFAVLFALALPDDQETEEVEESHFQLPSGPLLILCLVPITALLVEGAMLDWSVLFMRSEVGSSAFAASSILSTFALSMGIARMLGDWISDALGPSKVIMLSGFAMMIGLLVFGMSNGLALAALGAVLAGFGAANVYPLVLSIAPDVPTGTPEGNVASIALTAFTAFLIGPPLFGVVADAFSLSAGFLLLAPLGLVPAIFVMAGQLKRISSA